MKDGPYTSLDDMIHAMAAHLSGEHSNEAAGVPDPLGVLQAAQERYAAPVPFKPGDVVTPRALTPMKGRGEPHVVLEVGEPRDPPGRNPDIASSAFGARLDVRVACFVGGNVSAFWLESWTLEPFVEAPVKASVEASANG